MIGKIKIENFNEKKVYPLKLSFLKHYSHENIIFLGHDIHLAF